VGDEGWHAKQRRQAKGRGGERREGEEGGKRKIW
jgi:hypothetical protein